MLLSTMRKMQNYSHRTLQNFISRSMSSQQSVAASPNKGSPHIGFYKTFGRPIAKVLLMATLTYQLSYWLWVKLEKDEIISTRQAEILALEAKLQEVVERKKRT